MDKDGRRYQADNLASPSPRPNLTYEYKGYKPPAKGWAISREVMEQWDKEGRLHFPEDPKGRIRRKRYLDELKGDEVQNLWDDIHPISSQAAERLGYPTQKPEALLERIIKASSSEGDLILDPFCGCGTAVAVAQRLNRQWIGIDITHLAITLMKHRLSGFPGAQYKVIGEPTTVDGARELADADPYQFQWWALGLVGARPAEEKKGADRGIDGRRVFFERDAKASRKREVLFSVKAGQNLPANTASDLRGVLEREKADFGVVISLVEPTKRMKEDAVGAGFVATQGYGGERKHPKLQCVTVGDLLAGKALDLPPFASAGGDATLKAAPRREVERRTGPRQRSLMEG